jgi:CLIP-associating protein 1/2
LTLVYIRRAHHLFPIRPYLSLLVDCLEDTDPHVRECARHSIVELFSGPGVTDAARADLKKELLKKGVRKTIVDYVLSKLLAGAVGSNPESREGSENNEGTNTSKNKEYIPPSMALLAKKPQAIGPGSALARTLSHSSFKELQRPASRAAMASPPPQMPTEILEIPPVYVGHFPKF